MAQCRALGRNAVSVVFLTFLLFYIAYFTSELYTRLNNIRKLERLNSYERELTELTQLLQQYKSEAYTVGQSVALLEEVITKMADASRRRRNKLLSRDGANHARQDDIEQQLRILARPLPYLGGVVRQGEAGQRSGGLPYGEAGQHNQGGGEDHRLENIDPSGGEEGYVAGDRKDGDYNGVNLEEYHLGEKGKVKGRDSMRHNSVR